MKKISVIIFCFIFFMTGCSKVGKNPYPVTNNISFVAQIEYQNKITEYSVTISENIYKIDVFKKGEPTGFTITFNDDKVDFSYQGLNYQTSFSEIPNGLIVDLIYSCLNSIPKNTPTNSKDNVFLIENKTPKYNYIIYFSETGLPIKMEEKNNSITVIFKRMEIL